MKKFSLIVLLLIFAVAAFAVYQVGDVVANYFWTDNTGTSHDIYELTAQGSAIVFFWGGTG